MEEADSSLVVSLLQLPPALPPLYSSSGADAAMPTAPGAHRTCDSQRGTSGCVMTSLLTTPRTGASRENCRFGERQLLQCRRAR